ACRTPGAGAVSGPVFCGPPAESRFPSARTETRPRQIGWKTGQESLHSARFCNAVFMNHLAPLLAREVARRRTFAIIAHPDAGKTTLTEKLLLFGGAIQLAGAVKARGEQRRARSDWMKVERERGISVTASVMTFEHGGKTFNL